MEDVKGKLEKGYKSLKEYGVDIFSSSGGSGKVYEIGKPSKFPASADPEHRIGTYIRNKMNIVDLIPCDFTIDLFKEGDAGSGSISFNKFENIKPKTTYDLSIAKYKQICKLHGLNSEVASVRIYTTDETISTDEFRNSYSENLIEGFVNGLAKKGRSFRDIGKSVTSQMSDILSKSSENFGEMLGSATGIAISHFSEQTAETVANITKQLTEFGSNIIIKGNSISLPKTWDNSSYNPNTNCVIKLVSPYGHPDAIKKFIIEPLLHLILLSVPTTEDGVSYGYPPLVSVKAYGMSEISIASISGITIRRGGNDTSFNIYKQPLTIDVNIEFTNLVGGFAAHYADKDKNIPVKESSALNIASKGIVEDNSYLPSEGALFQTPGKIINSLRPINIGNLSADKLGLTGNFINSDKTLNSFSNSSLLTNNPINSLNAAVEKYKNENDVFQVTSEAVQKTASESSAKIIQSVSNDGLKSIIRGGMRA